MSIPVVFNSTSLVAARSLSTPYTLWHVEIHCVLFAMFRSDSSAFSLVLVFFVHASLATLHLTLANQNVSSDTRPGQLLTGCDPALLSCNRYACHDHYEPDELHEYASQLLAAYDIRRVLGLFKFIPSLALSVPHTPSLLFRSFSVFLFYCQEMAMTIPAQQSDSDSLYFKDSVSWKPPYFIRPFVSTTATTNAESSRESSTIQSFHSTADKLSVLSMDLGAAECQPSSINESTASSATSPCSHSSDADWAIPVVYTEMVEADRSSLNLALKRTTESTETADFFEEFEELTTTSSNGIEISQNELDVPYRKERDTLQFRKWIKSFRRKETNHRKSLYSSTEGASALIDGDAVSSMPSSKADTKTPSSSMRFVTAVKTASNTFASLSIAGGSTRRKSSGGTLDDATVTRMRDRRCALEELINTEEYYIADLKVLMNLYFSVLNDCDCISADVKDAIKRNVAEILDLHESLLSEIFRMLPAASHQIQNYKGKFLDISPQVGELERAHILSNPEAAAKVAEVFDKMMRGFFVYEEYSAKYELVCQDLSQFRGQSWNSWEKGCEMLAGAINSPDNQREYGKRALTLDDMLVKPIQRICKYPLFFAEIVKYTPAMDCPQTNRLLEKVRYRLEETAYQINTAKREAPRTRERIEKTWLLQDRIDFQEKSGFSIRLLGHIVLCGVLHVVWQRQTGVTGEYLACLLYKSYLLLATVSKADNRYSVKFAITLATARIEEVNQGRGLTCHSALFSWKIIFEAGHRIYEILVSACSAKEEEVWRTQILDRATAESRDYQEYSSTNFDLFGSMNSDVKPIGTVFGRPGTLVRHQSLHRSGSDPKSDVANVIIKNTHALSEVICSQSNAPSINRSLSVLSINRVPIFSPKRSDRNSIEAKLADVWTKDMLSFGSMGPGTRKRADTSNLMKRLSVVSLVSTVARKSMHSLQSYGSQSEASSIQSCESGDGDDFDAIGKRMAGSSVKSKQPPKNAPNIVPMKRAFSFSATGRKNSNDWKNTWRKSAAPSKDDKRRLPMTQEDVSVTYETAPKILAPMANNPTTDSEFGLSRECLKDISSTALNDVTIPPSPPLNSLKIQRKKRNNALGPKPNLKGVFQKRFFSRSTAR